MHTCPRLFPPEAPAYVQRKAPADAVSLRAETLPTCTQRLTAVPGTLGHEHVCTWATPITHPPQPSPFDKCARIMCQNVHVPKSGRIDPISPSLSRTHAHAQSPNSPQITNNSSYTYPVEGRSVHLLSSSVGEHKFVAPCTCLSAPATTNYHEFLLYAAPHTLNTSRNTHARVRTTASFY
jgi:hypothetical protein